MVRNSFFRLFFSLAVLSPLFFVAGTIRADQNIQANICPANPSITAPADGSSTQNNSINITGTGEAGDIMTITDNDQEVGSGPVGADQTFGLTIPLSIGTNIIVAAEMSGCSSGLKSEPITITEQPVNVSLPIAFPTINRNNQITPMVSNNRNNTTKQNANLKINLKLKNNQTVNTRSYWLYGTGPAEQIIAILLNGQQVARVTTDENGDFGFKLSLKNGLNTVQAENLNGLKSATYKITYQPKAAAQKSNKSLEADLVMAGVLVAAALAVTLFVEERRLS